MQERPTETPRFARAVLPWLTALGLAAVVVLLRVVEVDAEADAYHEQAELLLRGEVRVDPFHPHGYSLLVAAVLWVVGDSLVAGGLVSAVAAGVLVWTTGRIAGSLHARAWFWGQLFAAANAHVWVLGSMASSDMTGAALLAVATLLVCEARSGHGGAARPLGFGLACGFAVATRFAALTPVLAMTAIYLWRVRRARVVVPLLFGLAIGYAPEGLVRVDAEGSLLPSTNWQNLYFKVVCEYDLERLLEDQASGALPTSSEFVAEYGGEVLRQAVRDAVPSAVDTVPSLLLGSLRAPPMGQVWPFLLALGGLLVARGGRRVGGWLVLLALVHFGTVCLFWPRVRVFFPMLPLLLPGVAAALAVVPAASVRRVLGGLAVATSLWLGVPTFRHYLAQQPVAEVALAARLPELVQRPVAVLSPFPMLRRYVDGKAWGYAAPMAADPEAAWRAVHERMLRVGADLFLCGPASSVGVFDQLRAAAPPADLRVLVDDGEVLLVERVPAKSAWIASCTTTPASPRAGEPFVLRLELAPAADVKEIYGAGCVVVDAGGAQQLVFFERGDDGAFRGTCTAAEAGVWTCTPWLSLAGDRVERDAPFVLEVAPR